MKLVIVFVIVVLVTIVNAIPRSSDEETYSTKYDNIDIDTILTNERLLNNYIDCVEGNGKCTAEGEELKKHFLDGIQTCCAKCSEKQKSGVNKALAFFEKEKPELFKRLKQKYDPTGEHDVECKRKSMV